jgi:Ser/Thr protein kinase RdoA (MazF antagonist)
MRIPVASHRALFNEILDRNIELFLGSVAATLCHDDLHHTNVIFKLGDRGPGLAGIIDWDKAWAGPARSSVSASTCASGTRFLALWP